jgi:hypothetical protein
MTQMTEQKQPTRLVMRDCIIALQDVPFETFQLFSPFEMFSNAPFEFEMSLGVFNINTVLQWFLNQIFITVTFTIQQL